LSEADQPCIIILAAPSGAGKSTISARLMTALPAVSFSVSATTRPARAHEVDGVHYHFLSLSRFERLRDEGALLESEEVYPGCWYGTLRSEVEKSDRESPVLLDIDVVGAVNVKEYYGKRCLAIFVQPPSLDILSQRLISRGTETEASLQARIGKAQHELTYASSFDEVVINDDLDEACSAVIDLVGRFIDQC